MMSKRMAGWIKKELSKVSIIILSIMIISVAITIYSNYRVNKLARDNEKLKIYYETSNLLTDLTANLKKIRDKVSKYGKIIDSEKLNSFGISEGIKLAMNLINDVSKKMKKEIFSVRVKDITKNDLIILREILTDRKILPQRSYDIDRVFDKIQQVVEIGNNQDSKELKGIGDKNISDIIGNPKAYSQAIRFIFDEDGFDDVSQNFSKSLFLSYCELHVDKDIKDSIVAPLERNYTRLKNQKTKLLHFCEDEPEIISAIDSYIENYINLYRTILTYDFSVTPTELALYFNRTDGDIKALEDQIDSVLNLIKEKVNAK